jgi:CreA protein
LSTLIAPAKAADEPDLIFRRSTVFKLLTPNDKLATYGLDDPEVEGVACHFTVPERGGVKGWLGVAEEVSDISLACRQIGPIRFKAKFEQGEDVFRKRRSLFFKKMQIVRGCDAKRNVLVYMVYSDRLRGFAEEFDLVGADYALGTGRPNTEVRRLPRKVI